MRYNKKNLKMRVDFNNMMTKWVGSEGFTEKQMIAIGDEVLEILADIVSGVEDLFAHFVLVVRQFRPTHHTLASSVLAALVRVFDFVADRGFQSAQTYALQRAAQA